MTAQNIKTILGHWEPDPDCEEVSVPLTIEIQENEIKISVDGEDDDRSVVLELGRGGIQVRMYDNNSDGPVIVSLQSDAPAEVDVRPYDECRHPDANKPGGI